MKDGKKKVKLFMGCVIKNRLPFLERSARLIFEKLNYDVQDAPFTCCPDPVGVASISEETWLILAARNLTYGEKDNATILSLCNGCSETLLRAKDALKHNKKEFTEVNHMLGKEGKTYRGKAEVTHFVKTLYEDVGVKTIKKVVNQTWKGNKENINPVKGVKIAVHPGCHYNKPSDVLNWDNPKDPLYQEEIIRALGAIPVKYDEKTLCCGAGVYRTREDIGLEMSRRKYKSVTKAGAQIICVNCPACFQTLEGKQRDVNKEFGDTFDFPILYITELIALAFGFTQKEIGLKFHSAGRKAKYHLNIN